MSMLCGPWPGPLRLAVRPFGGGRRSYGAPIVARVEEDQKETQAIDAAIGALAEIGSPAGARHLRAVLLSEDEFLVGDTQWAAADALGRLVGEPLVEAADPVGAARAWLAAHPEA